MITEVRTVEPDDGGSHSKGRLTQKFVRQSARGVMVIVTFVLFAMLVHLLVTSSSLQWGVVRHYFASSEVLSGLYRTLYLTAIAMAVGIVGGTILALMRLSKSIVLSSAASSYIWLFRGTPLLDENHGISPESITEIPHLLRASVGH